MRRWTRIAFVAAVVSAFLPWTAAPSFAVTFTVNDTGDAGDGSPEGTCDSDPGAGVVCTLREAIQESNDSSAVDDVINFSITGAGPHVITPATDLPFITDTVTINGYSEPDSAPNASDTIWSGTISVVLDGAGGAFSGLDIGTDSGTVIRGLNIRNFDGIGVHVEADGTIIAGNLIGTNAAGTAAGPGNTADGVALHPGVDMTRIGGTVPADRNIISSNSGSGVNLFSTGTGNLVQGNLIGTDALGTGDLGNGADGVIINSGTTSNTIGPGNVISGNGSDGVEIQGNTSDSNTVRGNLIGTNAAGTGAIPNSGNGIEIVDGDSNTIGGSTATDRNVISGNGLDGIRIHVGGMSNVVLGNYIGTNAAGNGAVANGSHGVELRNLAATGNTIGGAAAGAGNLISANGFDGVKISDAPGNFVRGNSIGTNAAGTGALGNG
ncbi:MAG: hypothetical protein ACRDH6_05770, partial [Actinomycetota bacterium]